MSPRLLRWGMNLWPPFLGAGIHVRSISADWSEAVVELRARLLNRNYVGTHFGGDFLAPGRGTVSARFSLPEERVAEIRAQAAGGDKVLPEFEVEIHDREGTRVAAVHKTLYVRLKPRYRPGR